MFIFCYMAKLNNKDKKKEGKNNNYYLGKKVSLMLVLRIFIRPSRRDEWRKRSTSNEAPSLTI